MNDHGIGIERRSSAAHHIDARANQSTGHDISGHSRAASRRELAFHFHRLRDVTGFAHGHAETFFATLDEFRRCQGAFAGRKLRGRAGRIALDIKFIVNSARDRRARSAKKDWGEQKPAVFHNWGTR